MPARSQATARLLEVIARSKQSLAKGIIAVAAIAGLAAIGVPASGQATPAALHGSAAGSLEITAMAFCEKISVTSVSSLFGQKVQLLGASTEASPYNDVCEFAKIVGKTVSGVTINYDGKATGTATEDNTALGKEPGVSGLVIKPYPSIGGGTTYSFTDTFTDTLLKTKINESGMLSYNGSTHYGLTVTEVLSTSTLAKLLELGVHAA